MYRFLDRILAAVFRLEMNVIAVVENRKAWAETQAQGRSVADRIVEEIDLPGTGCVYAFFALFALVHSRIII